MRGLLRTLRWLFVVGELALANVHDAAGLFLLGATFLEVLFRLSYVIGGVLWG